MAQAPIAEAKLRQAVEILEETYRDGYEPGRGAMSEAGHRCVRAGLFNNYNQLHHWLHTARDRHQLVADELLWRPRSYNHKPPGLPAITDQSHLVEPEPEGDPIRIAVIGDAHDSPHLRDKSRFTWLGAYIAEHGFTHVVSVGDWMTMDCFSSHTDRATFEGMAKPTFAQDIESFHESQRAFQLGLAGHKPRLYITLGNHEARAWKYDNTHPDGLSHGDLVDQAFLQWGWKTSPYGEYRFLSGVGFVHCPLNGRSKPMAQSQRVNKALFDIVHGDDHRALQMTDYKSGPFRSPTVYSAATALPPGYIEQFANKGASTWRSGICAATVWDGYVRAWSFEEMSLLRRRYGGL